MFGSLAPWRGSSSLRSTARPLTACARAPAYARQAIPVGCGSDPRIGQDDRTVMRPIEAKFRRRLGSLERVTEPSSSYPARRGYLCPAKRTTERESVWVDEGVQTSDVAPADARGREASPSV